MPADGDEGRAPERQQQEQRLLQLLDALFFEPGGAGSSSSSGAPSHSWDAAALASLKERLLQRLPPGAAQTEPVGSLAPALAPTAAVQAGGAEQLQQQHPGTRHPERPEAQQQQQQQRLQRPPSLSAFELLMLQAGPPAASPEQQQQQQPGGSQPLLSQQPQPWPPAFLSQADDNMAASPLLAPASQQAEAGQDDAGGASPGACLLGTEASQPDPMQQELLQAQQELQRELLERREQQRERRRQQQAAAAAAAAAAAGEQPAQAGLAGDEQPADPVRGRQLAAASDATFQFLWRLLGEAWLIAGCLVSSALCGHKSQQLVPLACSSLSSHWPLRPSSFIHLTHLPSCPLQASCSSASCRCSSTSWRAGGTACPSLWPGCRTSRRRSSCGCRRLRGTWLRQLAAGSKMCSRQSVSGSSWWSACRLPWQLPAQEGRACPVLPLPQALLHHSLQLPGTLLLPGSLGGLTSLRQQAAVRRQPCAYGRRRSPLSSSMGRRAPLTGGLHWVSLHKLCTVGCLVGLLLFHLGSRQCDWGGSCAPPITTSFLPTTPYPPLLQAPVGGCMPAGAWPAIAHTAGIAARRLAGGCHPPAAAHSAA